MSVNSLAVAPIARRSIASRSALLPLALLAALPLPLAAQPPSLESLDARLRALEVDASAEPPAAPAVVVGERGLAIASADGAYAITLRGTLQNDARFYVDDGDAFDDGFLVRRLFVDLSGQFGNWLSFRLMPDFAKNGELVDAYFDVALSDALSLRVGRQKVPVSIDRLQAVAHTPLIERGATNELAPARDVGATLTGTLLDERLSLQLGVYNGGPDGRDGPASNDDDRFALAGRLFVEPFAAGDGWASGLGFGVGLSEDSRRGGGDVLPRYRTPGQNTFFSYRSEVLADGEHRRIAPQLAWYAGPFGLLGEWIQSRQAVVVDGSDARLEHEAWQGFVSWVLTGEDASYNGVKPSRPLHAGGWGALELVLSAGRITLDDASFPLFADPQRAAREATSLSAGVNWYLSRNVRVALDYLSTEFDGGAADGADRDDEQALFTRLQLAF